MEDRLARCGRTYSASLTNVRARFSNCNVSSMAATTDGSEGAEVMVQHLTTQRSIIGGV